MNSSSLMVSVVIPAYNEEENIGRCIDSLLNQIRLPDEILVVDDGSTDTTREIVQRYVENENKVRFVLLTQDRRGPGAARNRGIREAIGEVVFTPDADQFFPPDFVEKVSEPFQGSEDVMGVFVGKEFVEPPSFFGSLLLQYLKTFHSGKSFTEFPYVCRKELYEIVGGMGEPIFAGEDTEIAIKFSHRRVELERKGYRFERLQDVAYFDLWVRGLSPKGHFGRCIHAGAGAARLFLKYPKENLWFLLKVTYIALVPVLFIVWAFIRANFLLYLLLPYLFAWPYSLLRARRAGVSLAKALAFPLLMIYKAIPHLYGALRFFFIKSLDLFRADTNPSLHRR